LKLAAGVIAAALLAAVVATAAEPGFRASTRALPPTLAKRMTGVSWRPGCPVPLHELRLLTLRHWGFDGAVRTGRLVVHREVAREVVGIFRQLYEARFPIRRMRLVDAYGADDFRSIEADNTSAFNCRPVDGTSRWSEHAYGRAIDVNPIENPYVSGGRTSHRASVPYLDRSRRRPGMAAEGGALVRAFDAAGWGWGGRWSRPQDYQHFSAGGR
jgi:D-alanyl-D-alanine carboxypeptidase-like protein